MTSERPRRGPEERVLRLAGYLRTRSGALTREQIVRDVPGYPDSENDETIRKALQRDLRVLRDAWGIGTTWDESAGAYRLDPPFLAAPERAALVAAAAAVAVEGIDPGVPGELGTGTDDAQTRIVLRVHELVPDLRSAIAQRRRVAFTYSGRPRTLEPWRIALWRDRWYVQGRDVEADAPRWFRVDRIEREPDELTAVGEPGAYARPPDDEGGGPPDLDPNAWGPDPEVTARILVDADHVGPFRRELGGEIVGAGADVAAGGAARDAVVIELTVRHHASVRDRLLRFGPHARVLEPPALAELVRSWLAEIAGGR